MPMVWRCARATEQIAHKVVVVWGLCEVVGFFGKERVFEREREAHCVRE